MESSTSTTATRTYQQLDRFAIPPGFRGRSAFTVQLWWCVQSTLFALSPQFMYAWRAWLLHLFGARIGKRAIIRPTARITYPWKLTLGDYCMIGDHVELYTLGEIEIGDCSVISQRSYICTASHDYTRPTFDIYSTKVVIEPEVWLATDVFVAPGVRIGRGAVVGARSSVFHDVPPGSVSVGTPARVVGERTMQPDAQTPAK